MTGSKIRGVDFHCHLDLYPDFPAIITECETAGVLTLAVTTTPKAFQRNFELTRQTKHVRAALGLHPQLVAERAGELALFAQMLANTRYVGEVGLDASSRHYASFPEQQRVFQAILELCATAGGKILSVHSVRCARHVLDAIERFLPINRGRVVLHWFSGSVSEMRRALDLGCFFSVNSAMLENSRGRDLVRQIPIDRLLTETDGPFVQVGDVPARPIDTIPLLNILANAIGAEQKYMLRTVAENMRCLVDQI